MKALISPQENNRIAQVEPDNLVFEVAQPLYWTTCPDNCTTQWTYVDGKFIEPTPQIPTAEQNKQAAILLLQQTDWTTIADVGDPALSNPYLENRDEFIAWRSQVRAIAVTPIAGNLEIFNQMPQEVWKTV